MCNLSLSILKSAAALQKVYYFALKHFNIFLIFPGFENYIFINLRRLHFEIFILLFYVYFIYAHMLSLAYDIIVVLGYLKIQLQLF